LLFYFQKYFLFFLSYIYHLHLTHDQLNCMMNKNRRIVFSLIFFLQLFSSVSLFSQSALTENTFYSTALQHTVSVYHRAFGSQAALFNGPLYNGYSFRFKEGHPYFNADSLTIGSVIYNGILYDSIKMQYDEVADVLVVRTFTGKIQLLSNKVSGFHLYNSDFVRLAGDSSTTGLADPTFYNLLYKGNITLLKKQIKAVREEVSSEVLRFVDEKDQYYLIKDGHWYSIHGSKQFYKLMDDRKEAVKRFVKSNKLSFRKDRQNFLSSAAAYYDSLK
jgi:hypothetical protein